MVEVENIETYEVTLASGESISDVETTLPSVSTRYADSLYTSIDGGDSTTAPATYDLTQERYSEVLDDWMFFDKVTGETSRVWRDDSAPMKIRVDLTNTSGATETYRVEMISLVEGRKG